MGGPFQHAGVDVEDVTGKGLPSRRAAEQEGEFAIGAGVLGEIVIDDEDVPAFFHEILPDAGRRIGGDVDEAGGVVPLRDDDDGVLHRPLFAQIGDDLGDGGGALADGAIDAEDVLPALVENGIDRDGGLAGLAVAEDQLALAAPDGDESIDHLDPGLQGDGHGSAIHDGRGGTLDRQAEVRRDGSPAVEGTAQGIDHPAHQAAPHRHVHDPAGPFDLVARVELLIGAEQDDADLVLVEVEGDAEQASREADQFLEADAGKAGDGGDAGGDTGDDADFAGLQLGREVFADSAQIAEDALDGGLKEIGRGGHGTATGFASRGMGMPFGIWGDGVLGEAEVCESRRVPIRFSSEAR